MKKSVGVAVMFFMLMLGAQAQQTPAHQAEQQQKQREAKLAALMNEREQLVMEYQFYNQQNSNFWGKKSKKDLLNIIDTLKEIIRRDSELIGAVKAATVKKIAENTVESQRAGKLTVEDQRQINSRFAVLQGQISTLEAQIKTKERTIADLQSQLKATDEQRYGKDKVIAILAIAALILLLYAVFAQVRLNKALARTKTSKSRKAQ